MPTLYSLINEIVYAVYGFVAIESAVHVLALGRKSETNRVASALMACFGFWVIVFGLQMASVSAPMFMTCEYIFELCCFVLPSLFLHLHYALYSLLRDGSKLCPPALFYIPAVVYTAILATSGAIVGQNPSVTDDGIWFLARPSHSPAFILLWVYIFVYFALGYVLLILWERHTKNPLERKAARVYFRSAIFLFAGSILLLPVQAIPMPKYSVLIDLAAGHGFFILVLVWVLSLRYTFSRYREIDLCRREPLRSLLRAVRAPLVLLGPGGIVLHSNKGAVDYFGRDPVGVPFPSLFPQSEEIAEALARMERGDIDQFDTVVVNGDSRCARLSLNAVVDETGQRRGVLCFLGEDTGAAQALTEAGISKRETEILFFLEKGYTAKEIADDLCLSLYTVKNHIHNIYEKTGARNRVDLVKLMNSPPDYN